MTFTCTKCGEENISEGETFSSADIKFHLVQSSISGAGSRLCGPITQDAEAKND